MKKFQALRESVYSPNGINIPDATDGLDAVGIYSIENPEVLMRLNSVVQACFSTPCSNVKQRMTELRGKLNIAGIDLDLSDFMAVEGEHKIPLNRFGGRYGWDTEKGTVTSDDGIEPFTGYKMCLYVTITVDNYSFYRVEGYIAPSVEEETPELGEASENKKPHKEENVISKSVESWYEAMRTYMIRTESVELGEASPKIKYAKIVKGIRDSQGPFSVVATKNGKVVAQKNSIKNSKMLPIEVNTMADAHPGATIGIESKDGKMLNTFKESVELDEGPQLELLRKYGNTIMRMWDKEGKSSDEIVKKLKLNSKDTKTLKGLMDESFELDEKTFRDYTVPANPEMKKWIESGKAKLLMTVVSILGPTTRFVVVKNPNTGSNQDKVLMFTISDPKRGRIKMFAYHGSHVSHQKAMQFAKNNKLVAKTDDKGNPLYAKESVLGESVLKTKDKSVIDAFYDKKSLEGTILSTDGKSLSKIGMGGQQIAKWVKGKIKITAVSDVKSTQSILKYMKKSIPSGVFEDVDYRIDEAIKINKKDGPFTVVALKGKKVLDQFRGADYKELTDIIAMMKSEHKGAKISVEAKGGKIVHTESFVAEDRESARELEIYIENDAQLYKSQMLSIFKNLMSKKARGQYQSKLASKLFLYLVDNGAKKYVKEFDAPGAKWNKVFDKATRQQVADSLTRSFEAEADSGAYDNFMPKKYQTK